MNAPADEERKALIARFGWAVLLVPDTCPFGYTSGIYPSFGQPELFISGLHQEDIHALCNRYGEAVKAGAVFDEGQILEDWLGGAPMKLVVVQDQWKPVFLGKAVDDQDNKPFPALQAVWATANARYPWDPDWPEALQGKQVVLA